jgi:hypothetical protein
VIGFSDIVCGTDASGGHKASGDGRQNGIAGFEQYLETKTSSSVAPARVFAAGGGRRDLPPLPDDRCPPHPVRVERRVTPF